MTNPECSVDELCEWLRNGAELDPDPTMKAAVHLLTFTELSSRRAFAELLDIGAIDTLSDGTPILGDAGMLAIAVSLAASEPVDLRANIGVSGPAHARRLIEAMVIATGSAETYAVVPTPIFGDAAVTGWPAL